MSAKLEISIELDDNDINKMLEIVSEWTAMSPQALITEILTDGLNWRLDEILDELEADGLLTEMTGESEY